MLRRFKRLLSGMLVLAIALSVNGISAEAKQIKEKAPKKGELIQAEFTYIDVFWNTFDISGSGEASVSTNLLSSNVDEVRLYGYLQQYTNGNWKTIKIWSDQASGTDLSISGSWYVASGYSYRYKSYAYLYIDGALVESTSYTSSNIYY